MEQDLRDIIYNTICQAKGKLTPGQVERAVAGASEGRKQIVKDAIRGLIKEGLLTYTYVHGTSFLEPSFDRPVRISKRIVIKPPQKSYEPRPEEVIIDLETGAAFGSGAHPTTCLALKAIDFTLGETSLAEKKSPLRGLDVGTGTGILAIAMVKLGVHQAAGLDTDPCALAEAHRNVSLNDLGEQVAISNTPLEEIEGPFSLIVANLAYPTLEELSLSLSEKTEGGGILILTGYKSTLAKPLVEVYAQRGLSLIREETDRQWVCSMLARER